MALALATTSALKRGRVEEDDFDDDIETKDPKRQKTLVNDGDSLDKKEEKRKLAIKHAEIAVNEAAALNKLYASIILMEYFDLVLKHCQNQSITARTGDKKQDVNLANLKAIIKKHGRHSSIGINAANTIKNCRNPLMHNSPDNNELMTVQRLKNMTDSYATCLESLNEFDDANEIRRIGACFFN
jgi:hypothetical protein